MLFLSLNPVFLSYKIHDSCKKQFKYTEGH